MTCAAGLLAAAISSAAAAQTINPEIYEGMEWRVVGPFRGGRSNAGTGVIGRPDNFYMGSSGGGVWKTTNAGEDWDNVSDGFFKTGSVGAIDVSRSNPDVVYVGMGETEIRGNISHGDGVYISRDAGETWAYSGLKETQSIAKILVHPSDPDTAWVAALGPIYRQDEHRGIYKTTNGGESWKKVLFESESAGAIELVLDPNNPDIIYSATWEAWRTPYSLNSGGPGSKMWKSTDGGESWTDFSSNPGLPKGTLGKIGISVSGADSNRVYAIIEAVEGGVYSSDDAGKTWELINEDRSLRQRAWYYSQVFAHPTEKDTVYFLNVGMHRSTDGGKSLRRVRTPHSDNHDLWIDPTDPTRMINSNDGGSNVSVDGGSTWTDQDFATAQMYHVSTDNAFPYRILGAQQDNSTVRIPSRTSGRGIVRDDWTSTAGGESGYVSAKPDDPEIVFGGSYGGLLTMRNHRTGLSRNVNAWPDNPMGHGAIDLKHRIQWTFPIVFSPHDPDVLYTCSQHVLRSTNMGGSWEQISPDLTRNDPKTLQSSGGPLTKDNTGVEYYATVFTLAESPLQKNLLWAGSDDGLVHISSDGGDNWKPITPRGMPERGLCSMIEASPHQPGKAILALDNHENGDYTPHIYITEDYGKSWRRADKGIAGDTFVRVVREDPAREGLLYAGTETGVMVSFDDGRNWQTLQMNLPVVPVHDLVVKDGDLVAGTHGRSFWVLDNLATVQALPEAPESGVVFFKPGEGRRVRWGGSAPRDEEGGNNPMSGAILDYYLPKKPEDISVQIVDSEGTIVAAPRAGSRQGFNRISAWLQYSSYKRPQNMILWGGFPMPIKAPPGTYTVRLTVDGQTFEQPLRWSKDPRSTSTDEELYDQYRLAKAISAKTDAANEGVYLVRRVREQAAETLETNPEFKTEIDAVMKALEGVEQELYQVKNQSSQDPLNYPIKLNNRMAALLGVVAGSEFGPTRQSWQVYRTVAALIDVELAKLKAIVENDLASLNAKLKAEGLDPLDPSAPEDD
jgi:photosystem II stability/assembly factor-like uncharacterized protein